MNVALHTIELFAGVGMLGEGLRAGLGHLGIETRTVCYLEREAYPAAVLAARMAESALDDAPVWSDVTTFDAHAWRGAVDCVIGGFPCQDLSLTDKPPAEYVAQVQGSMLVTGRSHWWFAAFNPDFPPELQLHYFRVERDDIYIKRLDDALWRFAYDVQQTVAQINDMVLERRARNQPVTGEELKVSA